MKLRVKEMILGFGSGIIRLRLREALSDVCFGSQREKLEEEREVFCELPLFAQGGRGRERLLSLRLCLREREERGVKNEGGVGRV